jgi:hypothetical protein
MAEVYIKSNSPSYHQIFWNGEASDVDSLLPTVKVYDITQDPTITPAINPSTILTTLTASKDETNVGLYYVTVPYQYTDRNRTLKLKWEYIVGGTNISSDHVVYVVTPYTDLTQSAVDLGFSTDPSDPDYKTYKQLQAAEKYARKVIEDYTGQDFYLSDQTYVVYGAGSDSLPLPQRIVSLHSLYSNDILLVNNLTNVNNWNYTTQISESGFGIRINRAGMLDNTVYTANGMVPPTIHDNTYGVFGNGAAYKVYGRFGWEEVPDNVELACLELMKDYFEKDSVWRNKYVKNIQTFDWNIEYTGDSTSGTGNLYVDQLLSPYVISNMVVI